MSSTTLSIRLPMETREWLERFAQRRGSAGGAAARLIEEARRREDFPAVTFRDTPLGRVAWVLGTRVQVAQISELARELDFDSKRLAEHFSWPLWQAESVLAYMHAFKKEVGKEAADLDRVDAGVLARKLPGVEELSG